VNGASRAMRGRAPVGMALAACPTTGTAYGKRGRARDAVDFLFRPKRVRGLRRTPRWREWSGIIQEVLGNAERTRRITPHLSRWQAATKSPSRAANARSVIRSHGGASAVVNWPGCTLSLSILVPFLRDPARLYRVRRGTRMNLSFDKKATRFRRKTGGFDVMCSPALGN